MKRVFATLAVAALAAWAAPASAGVIFTHPGGTLEDGSLSFSVSFDATGEFGLKLSFKADGNGGINPCDGDDKADCLTVLVNGNPISGFEDLSVPGSLTSFGPTLLGIDDDEITLTFVGTFSWDRESFVISNIKVSSISEPAPLALFGLGLAGFGYVIPEPIDLNPWPILRDAPSGAPQDEGNFLIFNNLPHPELRIFQRTLRDTPCARSSG